MHKWLLRNLVLPLGDRVFGQRMMKRLVYLEEAQWWDWNRIESARSQALRLLISTAYNEVPLYRDLIDEAGVSPRSICTLDDLRRIPTVDKGLLRQNYPHRTTRNTGHKTYDEHSSGSTGKPFAVKEDAETAGWYRASFLLALEWAGWEVGTPHLQTGMALKRNLSKRLKDALLRCHYITAYDLSNERLDANLKVLEGNKLQFLMGYPGSLYYLARRAAEIGWNQSLDAVITWGDTLYPHYRQTIECAFNTRVYDTYGCAEGVWVSAQCGHEQTYHVHSLDVIVEYLDDNDNPVAPGKTGHLVLTRLHPGPMPLIRYRVGDIGIAGIGQCPCGRGFETMEGIQGRDTDVIVTPAGNRLIVHFFTGIIEYFLEVDTFQAVQKELDSMILRIVPGPGYSDIIASKIISQLRQQGADLEIVIDVVDEIPLTTGGKRRFVINELQQEQNQY